MDVGIDLTFISRFINRKENFISHVLTVKEYELFNSLSEERKPVFLATRWASKEAIFKATQDQNYLGYSILNEVSGKPFVMDHPEIKLSISHDHDSVVAIAIVDK